MNYLLDTNVLAEARRKRAHGGVVRWLETTPESRLYVSVLSLGEIRKGIAKLPSGPQREALERWLAEELVPRFGERLLEIDAETALIWGRLAGEGEKRGEPLPVIDALLAATALLHNLTLVTRNVRDFKRYPIEVFDPWAA